MTTALLPYETAEFRILLPQHWDRDLDVEPPIGLVAAEPDADGSFRANVVVTVEDIDDPREWQEISTQALGEQLRDPILLDERIGHSGARRLFHHFVPEAGAVTAEQWSFSEGNRGYTLTASAATFDYDDKADLFASIASGFGTGQHA